MLTNVNMPRQDSVISFGSRLRQERKRLGLSQAEFAELGGVKRVSQHLYEQDVRLPDLGYIFQLAKEGVDVAFLVLGKSLGATSGMEIPLDAALAAFQAIDELSATRSANQSPSDRKQLFASLCRSLAGGAAPLSGKPVGKPQARRSTTR